MDEIDLTKLSKRVRDEIMHLRMRNQEQARKIEELLTPFDKSQPVTWDDYTVKGVLPPRANVRFNTSKGWIEVNLRDDEVLIHAQQKLHISPQAANSVTVKTYWD